ncbi:hypothetical protein V8E36_003573 [Tilletia maclaganii]
MARTTSSDATPSTAAAGPSATPGPSSQTASGRNKGKERERSASPDSSKRARVDAPRQLTPELERVSGKVDERRRLEKHLSRLSVSSQSIWRIQYSGLFSATRAQLLAFLRSQGAIDLQSAGGPSKDGGGRQAESSVGVGVLEFTSEKGAVDALTRFGGQSVLGNTLGLRILTSTFKLLRLTSLPPVTSEQLRAEVKAGTGRPLLHVAPIPRQWHVKDLEDTFAPASKGDQRLTGIKRSSYGDSESQCWLEFDTLENVARCMIRFHSQHLITLRWAASSVSLGDIVLYAA